ncbi:MAG: hypothetical protein ABI409_03490 [Ramlibacter sp.]
MPLRTTARTIDVSRDKLFWAIASAMVAGQLMAFWMLCSYQVRKAQVRDATTQVERLAVADCLRHVPGATLGSCVATLAPQDRGSAFVTVAHQPTSPSNSAAPGWMSSAVPVNYVYR